MYTGKIKLRNYCWSGLRILVIKKFEDVKGVIRGINRRRMDNALAKRKRTKGPTTIYNALHRKPNIHYVCEIW